MPEVAPEKEARGGFSYLPRPWSVAVQLVGTFGLAVFLVLYYVLVMEPRQTEALDGFRAELGRLRAVVENDAVLVKPGQAETLAQLWIDAVAPLAAAQLEASSDHDALDRLLKRETDRLVGFLRDNGRSVAEVVRIRMDNLGVAQALIDSAPSGMSAEDRLAMCRDLLWNLFRDAAAGK